MDVHLKDKTKILIIDIPLLRYYNIYNIEIEIFYDA